MSTRGELHIVCGPMFSYKTSQLIRHLQRYTHPIIDHQPAIKVLAINHIDDQKRHQIPNVIKSHDQHTFPALCCRSLTEIFDHPQYETIRVIGIDEIQFFSDIQVSVLRMIREGKIVYLAGLLGDAQQQLFGDWYQLLTYADSIEFLTAMCAVCRDGKTQAPFTKKIFSVDQTQNNTNIDIGGDDKYIAVCRQHL
jgi:thymidine kinase